MNKREDYCAHTHSQDTHWDARSHAHIKPFIFQQFFSSWPLSAVCLFVSFRMILIVPHSTNGQRVTTQPHRWITYRYTYAHTHPPHLRPCVRIARPTVRAASCRMETTKTYMYSPSMKMTTKIKAENWKNWREEEEEERKKWCWNETKPKRRNHERPWNGQRGKRNSFVCRFFTSAASASARLH